MDILNNFDGKINGVLQTFDRMLINGYLLFIRHCTDSRQQKKVKHPLKDVVEIAFFVVPAGNNDWAEIADFVVDKKEPCRNIWSSLMGFLPMIQYKGFSLSCAPTSCRICWWAYGSSLSVWIKTKKG